MILFIIGFFFITIIGTLLHFTYDWSNHNKIAGLFSAVNESTWEHIKMALTSYFLWSFIDGFILGTNENYFLSKLVGLLTIITIIPVIFYGYKIFTKKAILVIDISTFFIAIFLAQLFSYLTFIYAYTPVLLKYFSVVSIIIIFGSYLLLTILPLKNFIFQDPLTKRYGLRGHYHEKSKK